MHDQRLPPLCHLPTRHQLLRFREDNGRDDKLTMFQNQFTGILLDSVPHGLMAFASVIALIDVRKTDPPGPHSRDFGHAHNGRIISHSVYI
jgi:hypothetical protein